MSRGRWSAVVVAVCLVVTVAAMAYAAGQAKTAAPKVVRAQRFELVDAEGRVRAMLGLLPDGSPSMVLYDEKGKAIPYPRMSLAQRLSNLRLLYGDRSKLEKELEEAKLIQNAGAGTVGTRYLADIQADIKRTDALIAEVEEASKEPAAQQAKTLRGSWGPNFSKLPAEYRAWAQKKRDKEHRSDTWIRQQLILAGVSW